MDSSESTPLRRSHSKLGLTVFVLGLLPWALLVCYLGYIYVDRMTQLTLSYDLLSPIIFYMIAAPLVALLALISLGLAIWSFFQKGYRKLLPILGVILTLVSCLLWAAASMTMFLYTGG